MHIKKQRLVTAVQRVYAECAIAKKETVNA
jgi:hypothetical protein